jgi:hypothetical protein
MQPVARRYTKWANPASYPLRKNHVTHLDNLPNGYPGVISTGVQSYNSHLRLAWAEITQSVKRLATDWAFRGWNSDRGDIFSIRADLPWGLPSLLYNGYRVSLPRIKRPGCGVDHLPLSTAEVKEKVELYIYSPTRLSFPVLRQTFNFLTFHLRLVPRHTPSLYAFMMSTGLQDYYYSHKYSATGCYVKARYISYLCPLSVRPSARNTQWHLTTNVIDKRAQVQTRTMRNFIWITKASGGGGGEGGCSRAHCS